MVNLDLFEQKSYLLSADSARQALLPKKKLIIVPSSGGKDSQLCLQLAIDKHGKENVMGVFNDTQWDHPLTYQHLEYLRANYDVPIHTTKGFTNTRTGEHIAGIKDAIIKNKKFPHGSGRFCTTYLKQYALVQWFRDFIGSFEDESEIPKVEMWFGMRSAESAQRKARYCEKDDNELYDADEVFPSRYPAYLRKHLKIRIPILSLETFTVFDMIKEAGKEVNPLYSEGTNDRVGCYPCLLASKPIQKKIFETDFGKIRLGEIAELEDEIGVKYEMYDTDYSCSACNL